MIDAIDDFIVMNEAGKVLQLCEKYYHDKVVMFNNGVIFAESMREAYGKQKGFIEFVKEFEVNLVAKNIADNIVELTFHYRMMDYDSRYTEYTGKHVQTWQDQKIVREEYFSID